MPKVSVYLPEDLYRRARERKLPVSGLAQRALENELRRTDLAEWIAQERVHSPRAISTIDTSTLMEQVRDEFGT